MKVEPIRDNSGILGFDLIPENETEKNLLVEFETTTVTVTKTEENYLVTKMRIVGSDFVP